MNNPQQTVPFASPHERLEAFLGRFEAEFKDPGDEMYGAAKHNNTILRRMMDDLHGLYVQLDDAQRYSRDKTLSDLKEEVGKKKISDQEIEYFGTKEMLNNQQKALGWNDALDAVLFLIEKK